MDQGKTTNRNYESFELSDNKITLKYCVMQIRHM